MRRIGIIASALLLGACTVPNIAVPDVSTTVNTVTLSGTKALAVAADAYAGVAGLVEAAVKRGAFTTDQLKMIRVLNDHAIALLNGTDKTLTAAERAASLITTVTQLRSILETANAH